MSFKEKVHISFMSLLDEKIKFLKTNLADLFESGKNETKSTAGDKHETALAMLQIEQENLRRQLATLLEQRSLLALLDPSIVQTWVRPGSLVFTTHAILYISTSLGKLTFDDRVVISVSPNSPLGQLLRNFKINDTATFNNVVYTITDVC